jgi:hypothetical protein
MGLYLGVDLFQANADATGLLLMPHLQYIRNSPLYSLGVGVDAPMMPLEATFKTDYNAGMGDLYKLCGGVLFYVRVAFGRTRLVFSDY